MPDEIRIPMNPAADVWPITVRLDEHAGLLHCCGRCDAVISSGYRIYTGLVRATLTGHSCALSAPDRCSPLLRAVLDTIPEWNSTPVDGVLRFRKTGETFVMEDAGSVVCIGFPHIEREGIPVTFADGLLGIAGMVRYRPLAVAEVSGPTEHVDIRCQLVSVTAPDAVQAS